MTLKVPKAAEVTAAVVCFAASVKMACPYCRGVQPIFHGAFSGDPVEAKERCNGEIRECSSCGKLMTMRMPEQPAWQNNTDAPPLKLTGLTFLEALKAGRPIRRRISEAEYTVWCHLGYIGPDRKAGFSIWRCIDTGEPGGMDLEDYLASDWEVMP